MADEFAWLQFLSVRDVASVSVPQSCGHLSLAWMEIRNAQEASVTRSRESLISFGLEHIVCITWFAGCQQLQEDDFDRHCDMQTMVNTQIICVICVITVFTFFPH